MTINEFIDKWYPLEYPELRDVFRKDLWKVMDNFGNNRFQHVATEILSSVDSAELILTDRKHENGGTDGIIQFGVKGKSLETGFVISYSKAVGLQECDWFELLRIIATHSIKLK